MLKFQAAFLASLLGYSAASLENFHTYTPKSKVTDHAAISYDQEVIEKLVATDSDQSFQAAKVVYEKGGNSKSIALLTLGTGLTTSVAKSTAVTGPGKVVTSVVGKAYDDFEAGALNFQAQYETTDVQETYMECRVGGLPSEFQVTVGCFNDTGTIVIGSAPYVYTYAGTTNGRTIQGFSTNANVKMRVGEQLSGAYFATFQPFVDYYGDSDYADKIISGALDGTSVTLNSKSFNFDDLDFDARGEIVKKGTAYLATGAYVIRELEDSIDDCSINCQVAVDTCNSDDKVAALDEAVAFYVGASHATDADGIGNLFFAFPEKRCVNFATCEDGIEGQSKANTEIFKQFNIMQGHLIDLNCDEAKKNLNNIVNKMDVAWLQGTMRYAWINQYDETANDKSLAEGLIFALGVLPKIHACDATAAETVLNAVTIGGTPNFVGVKSALESVYNCMGVTCADIGGLVDPVTKNSYAPGAAPCGGVSYFESESTTSAAATTSRNMLSFGLVGTLVTSVVALMM